MEVATPRTFQKYPNKLFFPIFLNYEFFIAKKIIRSKSYKSSISSPIIKIGVTAIAIGIIVMLISIATGVGLQKKITKTRTNI